MKPTHLLLSLLLLAACTDKRAETVRKLSGDVIAVHDEVMPKSEELMNLKSQIQERVGKDSTARPTGDSLVAALDRADNAMSDWMAAYDPDAAKSKTPDEAVTYFQGEKTKIEAVKKQTDESITRAKEFLTGNHMGGQQNLKIGLFNNVIALQDALSKNGIGELRKWRTDETGGWMSASNYFEIESETNKNSNPSNLAYYLESENESYVKTLKLVLNINNMNEKERALEYFKKFVQKTFNSLNLPIPIGMINAIEDNQEFKKEETNYFSSIKLKKSRIDTWELTIETK